MASYDGDELPENMSPAGSVYWRGDFWEVFDVFKNRKFHLKWGWFRVSFKLEILEPLFIKLIGARP